MQHYNRHWRDIPFTRDESRFNMQFSAGTLLVLIGVFIGSMIFDDDPGYPTNLYTELISIGVTVFILDLRAEWREKRRRERETKERLIRDAASTINDTARAAIDEIRRRGWLVGEDSLLVGIDLRRADLRTAQLESANLAGVDLRSARLEGADLQNCDLTDSNLGDANLGSANLGGATLNRAKFDTSTILPDGRNWSPGADLSKYGAITELDTP